MTESSDESYPDASPPRLAYGRDVEALEVRLLIEALESSCGYDFSEYARSSLVRRFWKTANDRGFSTLSELIGGVLHDPEIARQVLRNLSVHVTAMFRDPEFYRGLRREVLPRLATYPFLRIWVAGCSSGEEVYSVAILLHEAGLLERARIYATDMSHDLLDQAASGMFPLLKMREFTSNYQRSGGQGDFSTYYTAKYDHAIFSRALRERIVFSPHNLAVDGSFNEFHAIFCRNVLIYFNRSLQTKVHELFHGSLIRLGYLCLGAREHLGATPHEEAYVEVARGCRIYKKQR